MNLYSFIFGTVLFGLIPQLESSTFEIEDSVLNLNRVRVLVKSTAENPQLDQDMRPYFKKAFSILVFDIQNTNPQPVEVVSGFTVTNALEGLGNWRFDGYGGLLCEDSQTIARFKGPKPGTFGDRVVR